MKSRILGIQGTKRPSGAEFKYMGVYENPFDNVYDSIMALANMGRAMIKSGEDVAFVADIRADYVNKRLSVPVIRKKIHREEPEIFRKGVYYEVWEEDYEIYSVGNGFRQDLEVLPMGISVFLDGIHYYKLDLNGLRMARGLGDKDYEAKELFERYLGYAVGEYHTDYKKFRYEQMSIGSLFPDERDYLKRHHLKYYGKQQKFKEYRDVRMYKIEELSERFSMDELKLGQDYNITKLEFELELFTRLIDKQYWNGWTRGEFENVLSGKFEYVKYKDRGVSLIFKKRWI